MFTEEILKGKLHFLCSVFDQLTKFHFKKSPPDLTLVICHLELNRESLLPLLSILAMETANSAISHQSILNA